MWFKYSLKLDIKRIIIKIKIVVKVFITYYKSYWLIHCYIFVYVLFGCSTVVVTTVMWVNCMLGFVLRIWVLLVLTFLLSCEGYIRYSVCPSPAVYTWSWIFRFWCCAYIQSPMICPHLQEEVTCSSEMSVYFQQTAQHYDPENRILSPCLHFYGTVQVLTVCFKTGCGYL
jgi:hypothetical protein